jgi:hypothetical protein
MKYLFAMVLSAALLSSGTAHADVLYNNFGPDDTYRLEAGWTIGLSQSGSTFVQGDPFLVSVSDYQLNSITLPLAYVSGPTQDAQVQLRADNGGLPGAVIETFQFTNLPQISAVYEPPTTEASTAHPVLQAGQEYWLIASAIDGDEDVWQMNTTGDLGLHAQSDDGAPFVGESGTRGAFRVEGTAVPEPCTTSLFVFASLLVPLRRRRRPEKDFSKPSARKGSQMLKCVACLVTLQIVLMAADVWGDTPATTQPTMMLLPDMPLHDPWILTDAASGTYYLYTTNVPATSGQNVFGTMVYTSTIEAMPLKDDLSDSAGEPIHLFKGSDAPWLNETAKPTTRPSTYTTDGPELYRTQTGTLLMLWSRHAVQNLSGPADAGRPPSVQASPRQTLRNARRRRPPGNPSRMYRFGWGLRRMMGGRRDGRAGRSLLEPSHCELNSPSVGWHVTGQPLAALLRRQSVKQVVMRLDIRLGDGIGPVVAGMSPEDVIAAMPEDEGCYEDWMGGNLNNCLLYHGLRFHFDRCNTYGPETDSKLDMLVVHDRDDATLFGRPLYEWTKPAILQRLKDEGFDAYAMLNGDVGVRGKLELSFASDGTLTWVEVYVPRTRGGQETA